MRARAYMGWNCWSPATMKASRPPSFAISREHRGSAVAIVHYARNLLGMVEIVKHKELGANLRAILQPP